MAKKIEFEAVVAKYRRINIPKPLFQIKTGDKVRVSIQIVTDNYNENLEEVSI